MPETRLLDPCEMRVLGALLEKEQTTQDQYPLTVNALIAACNQRSNRDPVTELTETQVVEALDRLGFDGLTQRRDGARVERWEHCLTRRWHLTPSRKALITQLLLRAAQTPGELRVRTERMQRFETVEDVLQKLEDLAEEPHVLVHEQERRPGQRETRWMHSLAAVGPSAPDAPDDVCPGSELEQVSRDRGPSTLERLQAVESSVEELRSTTARLEEALHQLRRELGD